MTDRPPGERADLEHGEECRSAWADDRICDCGAETIRDLRAEVERLKAQCSEGCWTLSRLLGESTDGRNLSGLLRCAEQRLDRQRVALTNLVAAAEWLLDDCETSDMRQYAVDAIAAARIAKAGP